MVSVSAWVPLPWATSLSRRDPLSPCISCLWSSTCAYSLARLCTHMCAQGEMHTRAHILCTLHSPACPLHLATCACIESGPLAGGRAAPWGHIPVPLASPHPSPFPAAAAGPFCPSLQPSSPPSPESVCLFLSLTGPCLPLCVPSILALSLPSDWLPHLGTC